MRKDRERVTRALDALSTGLAPFVERQLEGVYREQWHDVAQQSFRDDRGQGKFIAEGHWDAHSLLTVMWDQWNRVFREQLDHAERSLVSELREYRNRWAHQADFNFDDTYRILDSVERLLAAVQSSETAKISREKTDLLRSHFSQEARAAYRRAQIKRRMWQDLALYLACGSALLYVISERLGWNFWFLYLCIAGVFGYLAYTRASSRVFVLSGPHECCDCGRVIYGEQCPYCEDRETRVNRRTRQMGSSKESGSVPELAAR